MGRSATPEPSLHEDLAILLVDAQQGFFDVMPDGARAVRARHARLLQLAGWLDLPVIATLEEPVADKGALPDEIERALPQGARVVPKWTFDASAEPGVRDVLHGFGRGTVAVAGGETDVCVLLTVEGLLRAGYRVQVLEDCVFSATPDVAFALSRMRRAGATPTILKTLMFELTHTVDREAWPNAWRERLAEAPDVWPAPDDLAPEF